MDGPERLEVGRAPLRRRTWWLVLAAALAMVVGLAVVRVTGETSTPAPGPTPSPGGAGSARLAPGTPSAAWPARIAAGTLYVLAEDGVHSIDASSGFVGEVAADVDPEDAELTLMLAGVLLWSPGTGPKGLFYQPGSVPERLLGPGRTGHSFLPAADGDVWVAREDQRDPGRPTTWVRADDTQARGPRVRVDGLAVADGAGGLFDVGPSGVHHVHPGARRDLGPGSVLAVGPDGYVINGCAGGSCVPQLHDRTSGRVSAVDTAAPPNPQRAVASFDPGALSSGNRFLAETLSSDVGDQVRVSRVGATPQVLRTFPGGSTRTSYAWVSDDWLVSTSEEQLVLYDAATDTLLTPPLPFTGASELVFAPV